MGFRGAGSWLRSKMGKPVVWVCGGQWGFGGASSGENRARTRRGEWLARQGFVSVAGGEAELFAEAVPWVCEGAGGALGQADEGGGECWADLAEYSTCGWRDGDNGEVVGGEKAEGGDHGGGPGGSGFFADEPCGVCGQGMGDEQVCVGGCGGDVVVGLAHGRADDFSADADGSPARMHHPAHDDGVGDEGGVGPDGVEGEAEGFYFFLVAGAGGDDGVVASGLQAEGEGYVGVEIAERPDRREDNALLADCFLFHLTRFVVWFRTAAISFWPWLRWRWIRV